MCVLEGLHQTHSVELSLLTSVNGQAASDREVVRTGQGGKVICYICTQASQDRAALTNADMLKKKQIIVHLKVLERKKLTFARREQSTS